MIFCGHFNVQNFIMNIIQNIKWYWNIMKNFRHAIFFTKKCNVNNSLDKWIVNQWDGE